MNVFRWQKPDSPTDSELRATFTQKGIRFFAWSNAPGDIYGSHSHPYDKTLAVVHGSITFTILETEERIELTAGDVFILPAGVIHTALVGSNGVTCYEGHTTPSSDGTDEQLQHGADALHIATPEKNSPNIS